MVAAEDPLALLYQQVLIGQNLAAQSAGLAYALLAVGKPFLLIGGTGEVRINACVELCDELICSLAGALGVVHVVQPFLACGLEVGIAVLDGDQLLNGVGKLCAALSGGQVHTEAKLGVVLEQAVCLSVCKRGDKIIMPRNVHRSAINALVLCGAVPVYVNPGVDPQLGIALGMSLADVERAIEANPDAKAVLVNNPTYYGVCSDLRSIVRLAHAHGMRVLADEAHGTHFSFSDALPVSAMAAGADMAAVSMHKSGGSLTQSSMLLIGPAMSEGYVRAVINLTQTTSASYLLLASLDISRRNTDRFL